MRSLVIPEPGTDLTVTAEITDDSDVSAAEVRWQINGGSTQSAAMAGPAGSTWTGVIPGSAYADGDVLEYWIWAEDDAPQSTESLHEVVLTGDTPIADARVNDANGVPLYDGIYARLTGVATVGNGTFSAVHLDVYIQDDTGGINIFQFDSDSVVTITVGNSYSVTGEISHFNGKTQISPENAATDVVDNGPSTLPATLQRTISELLANPESYEGQFVKIPTLTATGGGDAWPMADDNANVEVSDDGGTSLLTLRIDRDTDIDGSPEPAWPVTIQGIFLQFDNSSPHDEGYQLQPRSLADIDVPVGIEPIEAGLIHEFKMHQNYPNPFNPNTTLQFDLPENVSQVSLIIYNTLGQKVKTLVNNALPAGSYKVSWQADAESGAKVPSGVYFAVLKTNQHQAQRIKLVLLK